MKKLRFLRDTVLDFRTYAEGEAPNIWFDDGQADRLVKEGSAEVVPGEPFKHIIPGPQIERQPLPEPEREQ